MKNEREKKIFCTKYFPMKLCSEYLPLITYYITYYQKRVVIEERSTVKQERSSFIEAEIIGYL